MMTSGDLAKLLSRLLGIPFSTIDLYGRRLRDAGMLSIKGHGRGAAHMTAVDATTWLTSLCVDHVRNGDFLREVKRPLKLPLLDALVLPNFERGTRMFPTARTAGEAIQFAIQDAMTTNEAPVVVFDSEGAFVSLSVGPVRSGGLWTYQRGERERRMIEQNTALDGKVLVQIAKALGPPK